MALQLPIKDETLHLEKYEFYPGGGVKFRIKEPFYGCGWRRGGCKIWPAIK